MKLINEKGKLFGLVNIIDLIIILIILFGISLAVIKSSMDTTQPLTRIDKREEKIITYEIKDIREMSVKKLKEDETVFLYNSTQEFGTIQSKTVRNLLAYSRNEKGEIIKVEVPDKYVVKLKVKAKVTEKENGFFIDNISIKTGLLQTLDMKNVRVKGVILDIQ